jgi:hypothetical protein
MAHTLSQNAKRIWNSPEFKDTIALRDQYSRHPVDSSKYRYFSRKVARAIYDSKSSTFITPSIRSEIDFIIHVLSQPDVYHWESPIAHLIPRESDGDIYQDACPRGGGGFSSDLDFWWTILWLPEIYSRTQLPPSDRCFLSNNLLEYAAVILGLAGAIVAWESLPVETRPEHPLYLFWTDNMTAKAWTTKISGIKTPQGRSLARLFAHLLMFSDIGVDADHIEGVKNVVADFLSRLAETHDFSSFTYSQLQTRFPSLKLSRRFAPSSELLALVFSALLKPSVDIPTTRVKLGHMITESPTLKQNFFGLSR